MKPRWFWFGLTIFAVGVVAVTFLCASTLFGETPTTEALSPAAADSLGPVESPPTLPSSAAPVSEAVPPPEPVAAAAPQDGVAVASIALDPADPPVVGQGGTCISGFVIDRYHQARGAGWGVTITAPDGTPQRAYADASGKFKFEELGGGTWSVSLEVPVNWQSLTAAVFPVTLSGSGKDCAQVRFKVEALACLEVIKLDLNGQMGFRQKVGIPGWEITVAQNGNARTLETNGEGKCRFENLAPGTWIVDEEAKVGWIPASGYTSQQTVKLVSPRTPGVCQSVTFVNKQIHNGCIQVYKVDRNGNPLKGWKITLTRDDGTQSNVVKKTDAYGYATFDGLALGRWTVHEEVKDGWRPVGPSTQTVDLQVPGQCAFVTLTDEALGCVDGYKINHLEQGLANWEIVATNADTGERFVTVTDNKGFFQFHQLAPGTWTISEVLQTGWEAVTPSEFEVQVRQPFKCVHVRFKNKTDFACVDVFKKDYADGVGLPGWEITVRPAYGGAPVLGVTDGTGHVRFNGLTPGTYVISETMQSDWVAVTSQQQKVTLEATGICKVVTFKNRQKGAPWVGPPGVGCPGGVIYTVRRGDWLWAIARKYGTTATAIKRANGLKSNTIWPGQKLCIPDP